VPTRTPAGGSVASAGAARAWEPRRRKRERRTKPRSAGASKWTRTEACRRETRLSGVWFGGGPAGSIEDGLAPDETVPLLPEARKLKASRLAKDDPIVNCLPSGVPRIALLPWRIVQAPTHIFFLFESDNKFRQIFIDGRAHPVGDALNPTWYGHSTGQWDGDTLVVDTVGFNDRSWFDYQAHPHTDRLHVVERFTRRDFGTLENQITIDDPGAYARPFTLTFRARLLPGLDLLEYVCNENNKDPARMQGPAEALRATPQ